MIKPWSWKSGLLVIATLAIGWFILYAAVYANAGEISLTPSKWKAEDYSAAKPRYHTITSPWSVAVPTEPREIGYVTTPAPSFLGMVKYRIEYEVIGTGTLIAPGEAPPARIALYFQRKNDDWQCTKAGPETIQTQYYRWWSVVRLEVKPGRYVHEVRLDDPSAWGSCWGVRGNNATSGFKAAKDKVGIIGFTFGGGSSAGHGISVKSGTGTITFKLIRATLVGAL